MGVTAGNSGLFYYFLQDNYPYKIGIAAKIVSGTTSNKKFRNAEAIKVEQGYAIIYEEFNANEIFYAVYDTDTDSPNLICGDKVNTVGGYFPQVVEYENVLYIGYMSGFSSGGLYGVQIQMNNNGTCELQDPPAEITTNLLSVNGKGKSYMALNKQSSNSILGLGIQHVFDNAGNNRIHFSEYYMF